MIDRSLLLAGRKNIVVGLGSMVVFFMAAMLLAYLSDYEGDTLPPAITGVLGLLVSEDYFPSLSQFEWHLKYSHVHGEGLGIFCALYGLFIGLASRSFVVNITPWLVIAGTILVPLSFLLSMLYPLMIYGLTVGSVLLTIAFLLFAYDLCFPKRDDLKI